jgi:hypothetical protein
MKYLRTSNSDSSAPASLFRIRRTTSFLPRRRPRSARPPVVDLLEAPPDLACRSMSLGWAPALSAHSSSWDAPGPPRGLAVRLATYHTSIHPSPIHTHVQHPCTLTSLHTHTHTHNTHNWRHLPPRKQRTLRRTHEIYMVNFKYYIKVYLTF